jgi:hypothetical protein
VSLQQLSPAERQIIDLVRDVKRRGWGRVTVEIENGLVRYVLPEPRIKAEKDIDIRGEREYN